MRLAVGHADEHEPAATQISCRRMDHGQSESRGYGGVDRIATGLHDLDSGPRGEFVHADHDGVLRVYRLRRRARGGYAHGPQQEQSP